MKGEKRKRKGITGNKDVDRIILNKLEDKILLDICIITKNNKYISKFLLNDCFFKERLSKYKYMDHYKEIKGIKIWKQLFTEFVRYTTIMREKYDFVYESGDFMKQFQILDDFDYNYHELFDEAIRERELSLVKYVLETVPDFPINEYGTLYNVIEYGNLDILKFLKEKGLDIHIDNDYSLVQACRIGNLDILKYLVEQGANLHTGEDLLFLKTAQYAENIINTENIIKYLIGQGIDIHAQDDGALIYASNMNNTEIVKLLIELGANVHAQENEALMDACNNNNTELVKYLLEHGADITAQDYHCFGYASRFKDEEDNVYNYLIQYAIQHNIKIPYEFE